MLYYTRSYAIQVFFLVMILNYPLKNLPQWGEKRLAIHVKQSIQQTIRKGHPWLFDQAITEQSHQGASGDIAVIYNHQNKFIGVGLYDPASPIRVKMLQANQSATIDRAFYAERLQTALAKRAELVNSDTNGYRVVHGENDGLPSLIIDRYADTLVIKLYSTAWIPHLRELLPALDETIRAERWVLRLARNVQDELKGKYGLSDGLILKGDALTAPIVFEENGLRFQADVVHGHKTGFFFDQRDNRYMAGQLAQGRRVLDVFSYVGAFSLYAVRGGASSVLSVDVSVPALAAMRQNFALNAGFIPKVQPETMAMDAFKAMETLKRQHKVFDLVIIDPPSFAKAQHEVTGARKAYAQLTALGIELLAHGGRLVIASCSARVSADEFFEVVTSTAQRSGRILSELERTGHAVDHPIGFAEGAYLKCWFAEAED
jgi:23S rRNA (cytosine1962-C5)-methyltransferase